MTKIDTSDARAALDHLDKFCQLGIAVDPIGPKAVIGSLLNEVDAQESDDTIPVPREIIAGIADHFRPEERLTPARVAAILELGELISHPVGVLEGDRKPQIKLADDRVGRIYLSGPMTGIEEYNFPAFNKKAAELRALGLHVENPAEHGVVDGAGWGDYLRHDIAQLSTCETIAMLPGWSKSKGAQLELDIAKRLGMAVRFLDGAEYPQVTSQEQRSECWVSVVTLLSELQPDWDTVYYKGSLRDQVLQTIRGIAGEAERLRNLSGELYQILGALDAPNGVLDQVSAAMRGAPSLPYKTLLPFQAIYSKADEERMKIVLHNGPTGDHYDHELVEAVANPDAERRDAIPVE